MFDTDLFLEKIFANVIRSEEDLHEYQEYAVDWLKGNPYSALFIDVGLGKTVIILTLLNWIISRGYDEKILIIAPIKVVNRVWAFEYGLWRHTAYMDVHNLRIEDDDQRLKDFYKARYALYRANGCTSDAAKVSANWEKADLKTELRIAQLDNDAQIHLINQEAVPWLVQQFITPKKGRKFTIHKPWPYKTVIFDESSRLRDHNSEVFNWLKRVRDYIDRFHQLTATPAAQTYIYLFAQMWLLDKGERFGSGITAFRERYFTQNIYSRKYSLRPGAAELIEAKISDNCLVMRRKDYSDMVDPVIRERPIRLSKPILEKYKEFRKTFILETPEEEIIEATNAGALSMKLLQLSSGAVYDSESKYHVFHNEKIDDLASLVEETLEEPILVAYWFRSSLERLKKAFPKAVVMDKQGKMEASWNKRKHKIMLVHPQGVAHGLNLQFGGHHLVIFDMFWSLELFLQLIGRLDRSGQTDTVIVHLLSAIGTDDRVVSSGLAALKDVQDEFFERLRNLHRRIRGRGYR